MTTISKGTGTIFQTSKKGKNYGFIKIKNVEKDNLLHPVNNKYIIYRMEGRNSKWTAGDKITFEVEMLPLTVPGMQNQKTFVAINLKKQGWEAEPLDVTDPKHIPHDQINKALSPKDITLPPQQDTRARSAFSNILSYIDGKGYMRLILSVRPLLPNTAADNKLFRRAKAKLKNMKVDAVVLALKKK